MTDTNSPVAPLLPSGTTGTPYDVLARITEGFDVPRDQAETEISALIADLQREGLLEP